MKHKIQRRSVAAEFEVRERGGRIDISGYAAVFDQVAYGEVVRDGAFTKTLDESDDVRFLVNHDGVPMARTKSGTLELEQDKKGLRMQAPDLDPENPTVAELASAMGRGDIDQMSFAFRTIRDAMTNQGDDEDPDWLRELLEVKLYDVSVVTYPWYDETTAELNELDQALVDLHAGRALTPERRALVEERIASPTPDPEATPAGLSLDDAVGLRVSASHAA